MQGQFWKGCASAALLMAVVTASSPASAQFVTFRFATGPEGSVWGQLGAALKPIWEGELTTAAVEPQPGDAAEPGSQREARGRGGAAGARAQPREALSRAARLAPEGGHR